MTSHRRFAGPAAVSALLAALGTLLIGIAHVQGLGTIVGTVTDPSSALIPGATVRVTDVRHLAKPGNHDQRPRLLRLPFPAAL